MTPRPANLEHLDRLDRVREIRNISLTLGVVVLTAAVMCVGGLGIGLPVAWSNAFAAFQASGHMRWLILPLGIGGAILIAVGLWLTIYLSRKMNKVTHGEFGEL